MVWNETLSANNFWTNQTYLYPKYSDYVSEMICDEQERFKVIEKIKVETSNNPVVIEEPQEILIV